MAPTKMCVKYLGHHLRVSSEFFLLSHPSYPHACYPFGVIHEIHHQMPSELRLNPEVIDNIFRTA